MNGNYRKIIVVPVLMFVSASVFAQNTKISPNQEIISHIFASPVMPILSDSLGQNNPVIILGAQDELFPSWIAQILTDSCLSRKYLVYSSPDSGIIADYVIEISHPQVEINYRPVKKRLFLFSVKKGLMRKIEGSYHLQITDKDRRILFSRRITGNYNDVIPPDSIEEIENENLPFTKGTKSSSSFIKRWLEPVIITAATVTVIYLFYTLRSEK